jgi:hypothetical protein
LVKELDDEEVALLVILPLAELPLDRLLLELLLLLLLLRELLLEELALRELELDEELELEEERLEESDTVLILAGCQSLVFGPLISDWGHVAEMLISRRSHSGRRISTISQRSPLFSKCSLPCERLVSLPTPTVAWRPVITSS